jgi:hypothetical protein
VTSSSQTPHLVDEEALYKKIEVLERTEIGHASDGTRNQD